ncbi:GUN4 domain-containing protein [Tolypothrix bouteillei VB521301_2]|uniref:GUN4 domain-containing protein n=1 Tax=Tolypothrix bouteillei TaxID=1246981 RepID=UPI000514674A
MELSSQQLRKLQNALIDAFPTKFSLEQMLFYELNKSLDMIVGGNQLQEIIFQLIKIAKAQGWLEDLVRAACKENPGNSQLQAVAQEFLTNSYSFIPLFNTPSNDSNREQEGMKSSSSLVEDFAKDGKTFSVENELDSEKGVNYRRLCDLLKAEKWKEADWETYLVMRQAVGRSDGDWIRDSELLNFPCTDLRTIDNLWVKYSSGRFGFSVQKKIYLEVGGLPDGNYYEDAWEKFGDTIGWRVKASFVCWIYYEGITFDISAPYGHLPAFGAFLGARRGNLHWSDRVSWGRCLFFRMAICQGDL